MDTRLKLPGWIEVHILCANKPDSEEESQDHELNRLLGKEEEIKTYFTRSLIQVSTIAGIDLKLSEDGYTYLHLSPYCVSVRETPEELIRLIKSS